MSMFPCKTRMVARAAGAPSFVAPTRAIGSGASIGPIRRIVAPLIVCASIPAALVVGDRMLEPPSLPSPRPALETPRVGTPVSEPSALVVFGAGVVAVALLQKPASRRARATSQKET